MKQYKFKLVRATILNGAVDVLEKITNEYAMKGWEFKSVQYFDNILCFLIVLEKNREE